MGRRLTAYVTVYDEQGNPHTFGPDDDVPAGLAELISNPDAWAPDEVAATRQDSSTTEADHEQRTSAAGADGGHGEDEPKSKGTRRSS